MSFKNAILALVCAIFLSARGDEKSEQVSFSGSCDLGERDCVVKYEDKDVKFSLAPRQVVAMMPMILRVSGLGEHSALNARVRWINMNMGVVKSAL